MKQNFSNKIQDITPEYRDQLDKKDHRTPAGNLSAIRLLQQQGVFKTMHEPVTEQQKKYWDMVGEQCRDNARGDAPAIRFLKYLLAGFCMLVLNEPGHPAGTPFPWWGFCPVYLWNLLLPGTGKGQ